MSDSNDPAAPIVGECGMCNGPLRLAESDDRAVCGDCGQRYVFGQRELLTLVEDDRLPIQSVEVDAEPGIGCTVVIIAQGEDELAALDAVILAHSMWLDYMDKANLGQSASNDAARQLRAEDDSSMITEPHYTQRAQFRRIRHDVPTMAEWARLEHKAQGGGGADDADREERRRLAREAMEAPGRE